jgi:hypothetical protein
MIEPKPEAEPAALEELPAGVGAGAGSGAGTGFALPGVKIPSLPLGWPREVEATEAEARMTVAAIAEPPTGDAVRLAPASCCLPMLAWRLALGDKDPVKLEGVLSTALQPATPPLGTAPLGSAAVDAW